MQSFDARVCVIAWFQSCKDSMCAERMHACQRHLCVRTVGAMEAVWEQCSLGNVDFVTDMKTTLSQTKAGRQSHVLPSLCLPLFATLHVSEFSYFTVYTTHACPCRLLKRPR